MKRVLASLLMVLLLAAPCRAELWLPRVFGSNMVLQRGQAVPIWGRAAPGETVTVSIGDESSSATADEQGAWRIELAARRATPPGVAIEVLVSGSRSKAPIKLTNVLVGEVWLCSGQSNMAWPVNRSLRPRAEIAAADFASIRLFQVKHALATRPRADVDASWQRCQPATVPGFSAAAYFFGRELHKQLGVPIGLIHTSWGGTRIEPWTPPSAFGLVTTLAPIQARIKKGHTVYRERVAAALPRLERWLAETRAALASGAPLPERPAYPDHPLLERQAPSAIYQAMVAPLVGFAIRGAIWYQGESNRGEGLLYRDKMEALIRGWRKLWAQGDFPFYFVQLAPFRYRGSPTALPEMWEAQRAALALPNTGMALTGDIGDLRDIHPKNKQEVGRRLALWALARTYRRDIVYSGPMLAAARRAGASVDVRFDHVGSGLTAREGKALTGFELAGADGKFHPATARIFAKGLTVSSKAVLEPTRIRYCWRQDAIPNLANLEGLPACAFRADVEQ